MVASEAAECSGGGGRERCYPQQKEASELLVVGVFFVFASVLLGKSVLVVVHLL